MTILEQRAAEAICDIAKSLRGIDNSLKQIATLCKPTIIGNEYSTHEEQEKLARLTKHPARPDKETIMKLGEYFEKILNASPEVRLATYYKVNEDVNKIVQGIDRSLNKS